jgi:hypothetical protein
MMMMMMMCGLDSCGSGYGRVAGYCETVMNLRVAYKAGGNLWTV